ncbi:hypothetical protein ACFC96_12925 [Streptomyces sp. NPDC055955]|uniref:Mu transposase domain-containing protein n=1 Tax=Streptomyces sp. NPDC055955 TaxID=3345665 RepID=UPI0035D886E4
MLSLPPIAPLGWWKASLRLPRNHYVRLDTCDYSVYPLAIAVVSRRPRIWHRRGDPGWRRSRPACPLVGLAIRRSPIQTMRPPPQLAAGLPHSSRPPRISGALFNHRNWLTFQASPTCR